MPACLEGRDYNISADDEEETEYNFSSQLQSATAEEGNENGILDDARRELQSFSNKHLSNKHDDDARHLFSRALSSVPSQISLASSHMITKPARDILVLYKIKNCEYNENQQSTTSTLSTTNNEQTRSLSTHLVQSEKTNDIILKSDLTVPEFLFGASLPLDVAMNQIYDRLNKIILQIPNDTLQEALGTSMIISCADAVEHRGKTRKN